MQGTGNTLTSKENVEVQTQLLTNKTKNFTVVQNIPYLAVYQIP